MIIFGLSAALQWVLELKLQALVIDTYSGVSIIVGDPAHLMMNRLVMAIFGLSASLQ